MSNKMRGKENSKTQVNVRSPVRTRAYAKKIGEVIGEQKKRPTTKKVPKEKTTTTTTTKTAKVVKPKPAAKQGSTTTINNLNSDCFELIFKHVGVYDTIYNIRGVCKSWKQIAEKESLSKHFVTESEWDSDYRLAKKQKITCFEYCLQRVSVHKFYEKAGDLFAELLSFKVVPPAPSTAIEQRLKEIAKDIIVIEGGSEDECDEDDEDSEGKKSLQLALPWQYKEFLAYSNGMKLSQYITLLKLEKLLPLYNEDNDMDELMEDLHYSSDCSSPTQGWIVIARSGEYDEVMMCCDPKHPDFGTLAYWASNCGNCDGKIPSFMAWIRGLYSKIHRVMEEKKITSKEFAKLIKEESDNAWCYFSYSTWCDENGEVNTEPW